MRTTYKLHSWLTFAGTANILESRDNVQTVNHLEHNRDFSFATSVSPSDRWSLDLNYAYDSVYSSTLECYASSASLPSVGTGPPVCAEAGTPLSSSGYYNQPTQYGSIEFMFAPVKRLHVNAGYRMSAVNGNSDFINARQVPGSLQSQYQTPYGHLAFDLAPGWTWKADYNYYSFGEGTPIGPTLPRSFRGNVYTLALDAVDTGVAPGTLVRFEGDELAGLPVSKSVHLLGFSDLLGVLRLMEAAPAEVVLLGVQPESTDWGTVLTPALEAAQKDLVQAALRQIESWVEEISTFMPFFDAADNPQRRKSENDESPEDRNTGARRKPGYDATGDASRRAVSTGAFSVCAQSSGGLGRDPGSLPHES